MFAKCPMLTTSYKCLHIAGLSLSSVCSTAIPDNSALSCQHLWRSFSDKWGHTQLHVDNFSEKNKHTLHPVLSVENKNTIYYNLTDGLSIPVPIVQIRIWIGNNANKMKHHTFWDYNFDIFPVIHLWVAYQWQLGGSCEAP